MFRRLRRATGHWKTVGPQLACNILFAGFLEVEDEGRKAKEGSNL